ncbi:MAG: DNA repair protein RecO [Actinomycetaceae bacterium]|nr:DNA repair protein RecO [Actinomycetaceae bacterium]
MKTYRDEAIVLRTQELGEADRIIMLLTRRHGKVRSVAKGIRRSKSRFGARLEPSSLIDVQLYRGRTFDHVTEVQTLNPYAKALMRDYSTYSVACAMLEVADRLTPIEKEPAEEQFLLLLGAVNALVKSRHEPRLIFGSYVLRALASAGWALSLYECAKCGEENPLAFDLSSGGMACAGCAPRSATHPSVQTVTLMGALLSGDWAQAEESSETARHQAEGLINAYVQWQLERDIRSLRAASRARELVATA